MKGSDYVKQKIEIIERGERYKIYKKNNLYFVDVYRVSKKFNEGFTTLQGAIEHAYYQGRREDKEI